MVPARPLGGTVASQTPPAQGAKLHPHAENAVRRDEERQRQTHTVGGNNKKKPTPYPAELMFTLMVLKPSDENHREDDEDRQIRM